MEKRFPAKLHDLLQSRPESANSKSVEAEQVHIVFSCAPEDQKYATFLKAIFKDAAPSLVVKAPSVDDKDRLPLMDNAKCVVAFLSPSYLDSPEQVEEFNIALCRQRISPATVLFPIVIQNLPSKPTYFHLVPSPLNITDAMWAELANKWNVQVPMALDNDPRREDVPGNSIPAEVALGLHEAAKVLVDMLEQCERYGSSNFL